MRDSIADVEELSLEAKAGQLLHVGIGRGPLETGTGTDAGWPGPEMQRVVEDVQPGAVRLYGQRAVTPHFVAQYTNRLQRWAEQTSHGLPLLVACDSEYGAASVVKYGIQGSPSQMGRAATGDEALAEDVAAADARDLLAMGVTVNQQPVVDVNTNPANPVIGVRSPGSDPETVSTFGEALLDGVHAENQVAVAKHFPGHGDTDSDSHHELPHVTYDRGTLESVHLRPFEAVIERGVDCVMTSHVVVDCVDSTQPATLSRPVLTDILRSELGFDGVVVTDSMAMDAIADDYGLTDAAIRAIDAGVDLVLTGLVPAESIVDVRDAIVDAVRSGELAESRVDESVERILRLKERYDLADRRYADPLEALETTASSAREDVSRKAYEQSYTVLGQPDPLPLAETTSLLLTGIRGVRALEPQFDAAFGDVVSCALAPSGPVTADGPALEPESPQQQLETLRSVVDGVDVAVVTTFARGTFPDAQRKLVEQLTREVPVIVVSLGVPNEFDHLPDDVTYVATYAQERLGRPEPLPGTAGEALVETLRREPETGTSDRLPLS